MSKKGNVPLPQYPRAPPPNEFDDGYVFPPRQAPPSYEQSLQQQSQPQPQQSVTYAQHYPVPAYNFPPPYGATPSFGVAPMSGRQMYGHDQTPPVLELAKGAEVRKTASGAISIPPPPPGVLPSPAQLAAMQGQPVLVKEPKKRSFFSL